MRPEPAQSGAPGESRSAAWRGSWCRRHCVLIALVALYPDRLRGLALAAPVLADRGGPARAGPSRTLRSATTRRRSGATAAPAVLGRRRGRRSSSRSSSVVLELDPRRRDGAWPCTRRSRARASCARSILVPWAMLTVVTAITWQTIFEPELGFVNTPARRGRATRRHRLAGRGATGADGDDLRRRLEDGAVHGAAGARRVADDTRGDLRGGEGRRRDGVAAVHQASRCRCSSRRSSSR